MEELVGAEEEADEELLEAELEVPEEVGADDELLLREAEEELWRGRHGESATRASGNGVALDRRDTHEDGADEEEAEEEPEVELPAELLPEEEEPRLWRAE